MPGLGVEAPAAVREALSALEYVVACVQPTIGCSADAVPFESVNLYPRSRKGEGRWAPVTSHSLSMLTGPLHSGRLHSETVTLGQCCWLLLLVCLSMAE